MNKHIEQWLDQHQKEATNLLATEKSIELALLACEGKEIEYVNVYSSYGVTLNITIKVDSLREVSPLARMLARAGIRVNRSYKPEISSQGKTYYFGLPSTRKDYKGDQLQELLTLAVRVRGQGEGGNCKYVQVGEKTIPIMEWRCGDDAATDNEAEVTE